MCCFFFERLESNTPAEFCCTFLAVLYETLLPLWIDGGVSGVVLEFKQCKAVANPNDILLLLLDRFSTTRYGVIYHLLYLFIHMPHSEPIQLRLGSLTNLSFILVYGEILKAVYATESLYEQCFVHSRKS